MNTRNRLLGAALPLLGMLQACGDGSGVTAKPPATPGTFISTRFEDCGQGGEHSPSPVGVEESRLAGALHGVWVGTRTVRDGRSLLPRLRPGREPRSHYVLIYDTNARKAIAFEESGPHVGENAFGRLLPPAAPGGLRMSLLHCAAQFRDEFVKVSADPAAGLQALGQVTGTRLAGVSLAAAWDSLRAAGVFTRQVKDVLTVGALFDLSTSTVRGAAPNAHEVRLQMAAQYRGSAAEFSHDGATSAMEGGVLQGVSTSAGDFLVGPEFNSTKVDPTPVCTTSSGVPCTAHDQGGSASRSSGSREQRDASGSYRMVLGPLP